MKKIIIALFIVSSGLFIACDNAPETANVSKVTNYPNFVVNGDEVVYVQKGQPYVDAGVSVTENGIEIPYETTVSGDYQGGSTLDTNVVDVYHITYSAVNQDGFSGSASRTVIVYENSDLTTSIAGLYKSTVVRNGVASAQYTNMEYILVWKNSDGTYSMSDGIGGYYAIGRAYGVGYAAGPVTITANDIATNSYAPIPSFGVGEFGGNALMNGLTANPSANTLSYTTTWDAGFTFVVTMTKIVL
jgi:Domain of unknown function (DUF5011)